MFEVQGFPGGIQKVVSLRMVVMFIPERGLAHGSPDSSTSSE
jgi:hypothetical protein